MFSAGFLESNIDSLQLFIGQPVRSQGTCDLLESPSDDPSLAFNFEDSDEEDEEELADTDGLMDLDTDDSRHEPASDMDDNQVGLEETHLEELDRRDEEFTGPTSADEVGLDKRNDRQKQTHRGQSANALSASLCPPKVRIVVRDVAYSTYRAVLYYVRPQDTSSPIRI